MSFPRLYGICRTKNISVSYVLEKGWDSITFRRTLWGDTLHTWYYIQKTCNEVILLPGDDQIVWTLTKNGIFSVKSLYRILISNSIGYPYKFMWKIQIPQKIKMFLWLTLRNSILTQDNLLKRGWHGTNSCYFCGGMETIEHLFISCSVAKLMWSILCCAFNFVRKPNSVHDLFGAWLGGLNREKKGWL